jgi:sugar phosphate isomerase/epimerase
MSDPRVPRRSFLAATATSLAALANAYPRAAYAARPGLAHAAGTVKLGIASYSLRKFPRAKALEMMKTLRTPYANFKSVHVPYEATAGELTAIRQEIETAGFHIVGGGTIDFTKNTDDDVRRYFEYAKAAGMPTIVGTCMPDVLPRIEQYAKQYDIKVAIHNHGPEDSHPFKSPYDVLAAVKQLDPRIGLCIDVGHTSRTGTDIVRAALDAGSRVLDVHAKDLRNARERDSQCIVGEGVLPFPAFFRALVTIGFTGFVNLEYEIDADDPLPGMKQSFAYMRGVLAGQGITSADAGDH